MCLKNAEYEHSLKKHYFYCILLGMHNFSILMCIIFMFYVYSKPTNIKDIWHFLTLSGAQEIISDICLWISE